MIETLSLVDARQRLAEDDEALRRAVADVGTAALTDPYLVRGEPLGDACESLRDLVAHHGMWRELAVAILIDATGGRRHWSTAARWSSREAGQRLNAGGIAAGRELLVEEVLDRWEGASASLGALLDGLDDARWGRPAFAGELVTLGGWFQYQITVPGREPYRHALLHLDGSPVTRPGR